MTSETMSRRTALKGVITVSGLAIILPVMTSLSGCTSDPKVVTSEYTTLIATISALVIPTTDTPGAKEAGVGVYIEAVVKNYFTIGQRSDFKKGLTEFDLLARVEGHQNFTEAPQEVQINILRNLEESSETSLQRNTWRQLREMTIFGYYTSEVATEELIYEEIPGRYDPCLPFAEVGRAWL